MKKISTRVQTIRHARQRDRHGCGYHYRGAFGKIVSSVVGDIIMPAIGLLIGGVKPSPI